MRRRTQRDALPPAVDALLTERPHTSAAERSRLRAAAGLTPGAPAWSEVLGEILTELATEAGRADPYGLLRLLLSDSYVGADGPAAENIIEGAARHVRANAGAGADDILAAVCTKLFLYQRTIPASLHPEAVRGVTRHLEKMQLKQLYIWSTPREVHLIGPEYLILAGKIGAGATPIVDAWLSKRFADVEYWADVGEYNYNITMDGSSNDRYDHEERLAAIAKDYDNFSPCEAEAVEVFDVVGGEFIKLRKDAEAALAHPEMDPQVAAHLRAGLAAAAPRAMIAEAAKAELTDCWEEEVKAQAPAAADEYVRKRWNELVATNDYVRTEWNELMATLGLPAHG